MRTPVGRCDAALGWWTTFDWIPGDTPYATSDPVLIGHTGGHFGFLASVGALPHLGLSFALFDFPRVSDHP